MVFGDSGLINFVKGLNSTTKESKVTRQSVANLTSVISDNASVWVDKFNEIQSSTESTAQSYVDFFDFIKNNGADENVISVFKQIQSQGTQARATVDGLTASVTQSLIGNAHGYEGVSKAISAYNSSLAKTDGSQAAITNAIMQSNSSLGKYITNLNGAQSSVKGYISSLARMKATAIGVNIAFSALNAGLIAVASWAIGKGLNALDNWIHKEEKLAEAAKEAEEKAKILREEGSKNVKTYNDESDALKDIESRYINLVSTTNDITTIKGDLSSLQDEIIDKYGKEADGIDIVNGKLSENLDLMLKLQEEKNTQWLRDNKDNISAAEDYLTGRTLASFKITLDGNNDLEKEISEARKYYDYLKDYISQNNLSQYIRSVDALKTDNPRAAFELRDDLSPEDYEKATKAFTEAYETMVDAFGDEANYFDLSGNRLTNLYSINKELEQSVEILKQKIEIEKENADLEEAVGSEQYNRYKDLITQAQKLSQELNDPNNTPTTTYAKQLELNEVKDDISALTAEFPVLADSAERAFKNMGLNIDGAIASTTDLRTKFFENLDEMQKGTLANVDSIEKAMQTLADGGELDFKEAWAIWDLDTTGILQPYLDDNDQLKIDYKELARLKNYLIQQEQERLRTSIETAQQERKNAQTELAAIEAEINTQAKGNTKPNEDFLRQESELRKQIQEWGEDIQRNELLIGNLNSRLGETITSEEKIKKIQEDINDLQSKADNYEKAFTQKIDNLIDSLEDEKEILNDELDSLNEQLDVLEKQKDELDEIIDNYKQVADIVSDAVDKEKELLEEQRKSQEDAYNERINALKEAHEQQEEENELTEKQIALQEKLQALEKAKQNKVMTYSSERGWHYDVDKEELLAAQKEADKAQKDLDDTLAERAYEAEIKALEDERDSVLENYDLQIEAYENYVKEWKEILEEQTNAENERLAQEILGSDWREKIKDKDTLILNNYKSEFRNYNSQLSTLVNGEMANLKKSIEAKDAEIKAKQELIDQWKNYKSEVQKAVNDIKNANEDYMQYLDGIVLDENSSLEEREANLANFTANYKSYMDEIIDKNNELAAATNQMNELANAMENVGSIDFNGFISGAKGLAESIKDALESAIDDLMSPGTGLLGAISLGGNIPRFANGGINDSTGLAMLHGTKSRPELVLNNTDAAKLYDMIHNSSFVDMMMERNYGHLLKNNPITNNNSTNNTSNTVHIDHMEIKTPDPLSFHDQFQKELKQHYRFALSESKVTPPL
ncbi:MAG: hypothetical protein NC485_14830, partial [Ruminococcus flavefaciens]|nr:hypothetical protein [Ruminococcus flavefaciens]MCM1062469.1 hypothetical protein [Eubacterium sp.]